jgi:hypothetical protein
MMAGVLGKTIPKALRRISSFERRKIRPTTSLKLILAIFADSIYLGNNPSEIPATGVVGG